MSRGVLHVVGIGPGDAGGVTGRALEALRGCDLIVGYDTYVELASRLAPGVRTASTPMTREVERCRMALEQASAGADVALVCSGDAGVYGMASPVLELAADFPDVEVDVVCGVSAAQSAAALLGAPLGHDFATVSLSDRLTPWDVIERRLRACVGADMCLVLYNPRSRGRSEHLARAARAMLDAGASEHTVCGWARAVGRPGQACGTLELGELGGLDADMFTTVFVGNSATRLVRGRMVTPRGYGGLR